MTTVSHPQGAVREIPDSDVEAYLVLGWELGPPQPAPAPTMGWRRIDLVEHARARGIEVTDRATKRQILDSLNALEEPTISGAE